ncbi:Aldehyde-alcohol dehydrogenase [Hondaea fermentalgiana]|uniref:Aldehyde-alcohol dehydrogenase n=1 Tax=Hondaea fermentalgiana TaxID=2315210 RepID=A0A2R5GCJ5_9STRA|nr:Aldehyde-alcohol dehydrogenase [Hondaea fermentalgiana]|eukprot:GBG28700.1 Aldehyde-alcohol dehydrogenase [Hondaea fermentalgiana]
MMEVDGAPQQSDDEVKNNDAESDVQSWCTESAAALTPEEEMGELIARARAAQSVVESYSQEQVDRLIRGMVWAVARPGVAEEIAHLAVTETRLGNYEGKLAKIAQKTRAGLLDILHERSVGVIEEDAARGIAKIAKPIGVIGATSPSTNPEATPVLKAINAIKARNAIVISPHPRAEKTNKVIVEKMRSALTQLGAPADLVLHVAGPSRAKTKALLAQSDLVWATGGKNIAKNALMSGKPAFPSGVGNAAILVDETADLGLAAACISRSKTFDNAASCSADNAVLAVDAIYDAFVAALEAAGGYLVADVAERAALQRTLFKQGPNGIFMLNAEVVVQPAHLIAARAGINLPAQKTFLIVPESGAGAAYPFSGEKLSPVLALYRVHSVAEGVDLTNRIQAYQGHGHSCGIFSTSDANIMAFSSGTRTARVMVNQPQSLSNSGSLSNGMPVTLSLGCGTWGCSTSTANINWRALVNLTWVSRPLSQPKVLPADIDLFGDVVRLVQDES